MKPRKLTAMLVVACLMLALLPNDAAAASPPANNALEDIEKRYSLTFSFSSNTDWNSAENISEMIRALESYPPGMVEQALDFYYMMSGVKPVVKLSRPSSRSSATAAVTTRTNRYEIIINMMISGNTADTFCHELAHVIHFYIMDCFGDSRLSSLYAEQNGSLKYVGGNCFDVRYKDYIGTYFPTAYAMYSYEEDVAELVKVLCLESDTVSKYISPGSGPLYQKTVNTADEFLRRTILLKSRSEAEKGSYWISNFGYLQEYQSILPGLSIWAAEPYRKAMDANLLPPDAFLSDAPQAQITRLHFSFLATRLIEIYGGNTLYRLAVSKGVTNIFTRRSFLPYNDISGQNRMDTYANLHYLRELGVMSGTGRLTFNPDGVITRAQAAVLLTNIAKLAGFYTKPPAVSYSDASSVPDWAADGVAFMSHTGVMGGTGGNRFQPNQPYTYEQALISMHNMYNWLSQQANMKKAA